MTKRSVPLSASAIAWTAKGLTVVRAPIQTADMPASRTFSTCSGVATSVMALSPVVASASMSHGRACSPRPSNELGLVRGFHSPARKN